MKKLGFVSALGMMGRRHAIGLARAGFDITTTEINPAAALQLKNELRASDL
jgi:3-hydroxyacyl-CoA dehydrogenase